MNVYRALVMLFHGSLIHCVHSLCETLPLHFTLKSPFGAAVPLRHLWMVPSPRMLLFFLWLLPCSQVDS